MAKWKKAAHVVYQCSYHLVWSRGYCVTTVGIDEEKIRRYVKYQEEAERLNEDHELQEGLF